MNILQNVMLMGFILINSSLLVLTVLNHYKMEYEFLFIFMN